MRKMLIKQPREEAADDDQRKRALGVGADAGCQGGRQQAERSDQRGHHDRPEPQQRRFRVASAMETPPSRSSFAYEM